MRIAFLGNFEPEYSTENDIFKTFLILGHDVMTVQESTATREQIDGACAGAHLFLWMHTHGWNPPIDEDWLRRQTIPTVGYTLDLFRGLKRHDPDYVTTYPWFKCQWFFQPDDPAWLREHGCMATFMPPAILQTSCYLAPPFNDDLEIIFVGSEEYHPEWPWRKEMLAYLRSWYGSRFHIFPHSSGMRGHRLNRLYATAKLVVGDSCFASPKSPYTSDRLYETRGRGGCLIYPRIDSEHCADEFSYHAGDHRDLRYVIEANLAAPMGNDERRLQIDAIRESDTYTQRMEQMLSLVEKGRYGSASPVE